MRLRSACRSSHVRIDRTIMSHSNSTLNAATQVLTRVFPAAIVGALAALTLGYRPQPLPGFLAFCLACILAFVGSLLVAGRLLRASVPFAGQGHGRDGQIPAGPLAQNDR